MFLNSLSTFWGAVQNGNLPKNQSAYFNITYLNYEIPKFITLYTTKPPIKIKKNANTEYFFEYELRLKSNNRSIDPDIYYLDDINFGDKYITKDGTKVLRIRSKLQENQDSQYIQINLIYTEKTHEIIDTYKKIKINNEESIDEIFESNIQPIILKDGIINFAAPREIGQLYDKNFQVKEVYFIINNQKLYATKYNNFNEMQEFFVKAYDSFAGYSIEELKNNYKILMLAFRVKSDKSFGVHYTITGIINNSVIRDSNDIFTKEVNINPEIEMSPNTLLTTEVEIPDGYFIDPNSVNYRDLLVTNPNINSKSIVWQFKNYNIDPLVQFKFSFSKNEKKIANILLFFNLGFLIVILLVYVLIPKEQQLQIYIDLVIFSIANIIVPLALNLEFINIFFYSKAYLPLLITLSLILHNNKKNILPSRKEKGKRLSKR